MAAHALAYAKRGWPVFPAIPTQDRERGSKAPYLPKASAPGRKDGGHWLASTDPDIIRGWWQRWPSALIGLPTGLRSGTVVVDLDPRESPLQAMLEALKNWCGGLTHVDRETGEVTSPAISITQSGGLHLWFAYPSEDVMARIGERCAARQLAFPGRVENPTGVFRRFLAAGEVSPHLSHIDVRGEGGYVIAPPSVMEDGKSYVWLRPPAEGLAPMPTKLLAVIVKLLRPRDETARLATSSSPCVAAHVSDRRVTAYVSSAVAGILSRLRQAGDGQRHQAILNASLGLGAFVRGGFINEADAEAWLQQNLPAGVSAGERKATETIRYGLKGGPDPSRVPAFSPADLGPPRRPVERRA